MPRIPSIEIVVKGPGAAEALVTLDGKRVPKALIGVKTFVNPGDHKIGASTETHVDVEEVTITEKQLSRVVLELEPKGSANTGQPPIPDKPVLKTPVNGKRVAGFVVLGVGGAFTIVGIAAGIDAMSIQNDMLEPKCPSGKPTNDPYCVSNEYNYFYKTFVQQRNLSAAGFVVGGVGIVTGVVLLVLAAKSKPAPQPTTSSLHIEPWIGAGSAGFRGTF
jgi:hypothetical protein